LVCCTKKNLAALVLRFGGKLKTETFSVLQISTEHVSQPRGQRSHGRTKNRNFKWCQNGWAVYTLVTTYLVHFCTSSTVATADALLRDRDAAEPVLRIWICRNLRTFKKSNLSFLSFSFDPWSQILLYATDRQIYIRCVRWNFA
jgi:hypothetical protein